VWVALIECEVVTLCILIWVEEFVMYLYYSDVWAYDGLVVWSFLPVYLEGIMDSRYWVHGNFSEGVKSVDMEFWCFV
jgi:hypothetical protein